MTTVLSSLQDPSFALLVAIALIGIGALLGMLIPQSPTGRILKQRELYDLCCKVAYCGLSRKFVDADIESKIHFNRGEEALLITKDGRAIQIDINQDVTWEFARQVKKIIPLTGRTFIFVDDTNKELFRIFV